MHIKCYINVLPVYFKTVNIVNIYIYKNLNEKKQQKILISLLDINVCVLLSVLCHLCCLSSGRKTSFSLAEMNSPGRFVLWVGLCEQPGFTSSGTFPLTTMETKKQRSSYTPVCETMAVSAFGRQLSAGLRAIILPLLIKKKKNRKETFTFLWGPFLLLETTLFIFRTEFWKISTFKSKLSKVNKNHVVVYFWKGLVHLFSKSMPAEAVISAYTD